MKIKRVKTLLHISLGLFGLAWLCMLAAGNPVGNWASFGAATTLGVYVFMDFLWGIHKAVKSQRKHDRPQYISEDEVNQAHFIEAVRSREERFHVIGVEEGYSDGDDFFTAYSELLNNGYYLKVKHKLGDIFALVFERNDDWSEVNPNPDEDSEIQS